MQLVSASEILDIAQYEKVRPEFRARVMAEKDRRRVTVGPVFTFLFENHLTMLYQVQEMMRAERIVEDKAIAEEIATYNELLPPPGGLSASLLIEYAERAEREQRLAELVGLQDHVKLVVGDQPPVKAVFDQRQYEEKRVSSVQYIKFPLAGEHRAAWKAAGEAGRIRLVVDHPAYTHERALPPEVVQALGEDLAEDLPV